MVIFISFPSSRTPFTKQKPQAGCMTLGKYLPVLEPICPSIKMMAGLFLAPGGPSVGGPTSSQTRASNGVLAYSVTSGRPCRLSDPQFPCL